MMNKFAFGKIAEDKKDFFSHDIFNDDTIEKSFPIADGDGSSLPTSIPTPFARLDLVKTAFNELGQDGAKVDGTTDKHKLVSDALDIGQLLFNYERHRNKLTISKWNREEEIKKLNDFSKKHKHLAETLELFLKQDSEGSSSYNFHLLENMYVLKYNHKVIGGTSPRTLFFAAPDALPLEDISFGSDTPLDSDTRALYLRDEAFIIFMYALYKGQSFSVLFPEVHKYIKRNLKLLESHNNNLWNSLNNMNTEDYLKNTPNLLYKNNDGTPIEVINTVVLKQRQEDPIKIMQSDFVINSSKFLLDDQNVPVLPLVLPVDPFNKKWIYTSDFWDMDTRVSTFDDKELKERKLPGQAVSFPYLTMNDFLTDEIIRLPKGINDNYFFTVEESNFMFPLTAMFFNYFSSKELLENKMIKFRVIGDALEVNLKIPARKGTISYTKLYYNQADINSNVDKKKGVIVDKIFSLSIFPPVEKPDGIPIDYYVGISQMFPDERSLPMVNFYNSKNSCGALPLKSINPDDTSLHNFKKPIKPADRGVRSKNDRFYNQQSYFSDYFDAIVVSFGAIENVLIPNLKVETEGAGHSYHFAIDFGTTNTHIECSVPNSDTSESFSFDAQKSQLALLFKNEGTTGVSRSVRDLYGLQDFLIQETINTSFGKASDMYEAPFRTVMLHNAETNWASANVINQANIGFDYEKKSIRQNLHISSDIKWSTDEQGKKLLAICIEQLLLLCKNKVLLEKGNITTTKISWLYPVSMGVDHRSLLENIWADKYIEIFKGNPLNITSYPESITPYYEFDDKVEGDRPLVSIDIGGGTTDVLISKGGKTELITSFKFAGNSLYGGGTKVKNNSFVKHYANLVTKMLSDQKLKVPSAILDRIVDNGKGKSEDVMSYLFSLNNNQELKEKGVDFDLGKSLAIDGDAKMIFLLYYSALIYHIAELTKLQELDVPRNLMFSGNASKMLSILDSKRDQLNLNSLSLLIFQHVFDIEESKDLTVLLSKNPKAMTAKGALRIAKEAEEATNDIDYIKLIRIHTGLADSQQMHNPRRKKEAPGITYATMDNEGDIILANVLKNYNQFMEMFFALDDEINFRDTFSVSLDALNNVKSLKDKDVKAKLNMALKRMRDGRGDEDYIDETLFFYPVINLIENLSNELKKS